MKVTEPWDQEIINLVLHETYRLSGPDGTVYMCVICH